MIKRVKKLYKGETIKPPFETPTLDKVQIAFLIYF